MTASKRVISARNGNAPRKSTYSVQKHNNLITPEGSKLFKIKGWEIAFVKGGKFYYAHENTYTGGSGIVYNNRTVAYDYIPPQYVCNFIQKKVLEIAKTTSGRAFLGVPANA